MEAYPPTVLIVDDEVDIRELWCQALRPLGLQVLEAGSVTQALRTMKREAVDVLVLDWRLGDDTAEVVMDSWVGNGGGPLCVISGTMNPPDLTHLLSRGAYNVLTKPITVETIVSVIGRYVSWVRVLRELKKMRVELAKMRKLVVVAIAIAIGTRLIPTELLTAFVGSLL